MDSGKIRDKAKAGRRVVITGLGTVNPCGLSVEESFENIKNGRVGIAPITRFSEPDFSVKLAGEVKDFDPLKYMKKKDARHMDIFTQYAVAAADEAMKNAGLIDEDGSLADGVDPKKFGTDISSGIGGLTTIEEQHLRGMDKGFERVSPYFIPMSIANMAAGQVAIRYGLKGMATCPVAACAGGTLAIGDSFHLIRDGYADMMICGGTESCITALAMGGFSNMGALTKSDDKDRASIPFDAERSGFVMGEGCGLLVLEEYQHAYDRHANIICEIAGYGANCDAYHITSPDPSGEGAADVFKLCLEDAGVLPEEVDYINAHGTSTKLNDLTETKAIHAVFGEHAEKLKISSTKSMTGHLLGGAGGVEGVFTAKTIEEGFIPPTANLDKADPDCDLDYVAKKGIKQDVNIAMSDSLGFGGHNACILMRKV
ncbi:MAG: beta-ketoacyl-[acyl-carrier-protein] synthase II [Lachnospiraceae bacterium]|uniref:3-oxoacyl-[acyl-carrier-protein] synthase 2 n=1 Tax=Candidatus Weimeria bifida TaxID=2599074 RepID=A0A6N7J216_9FIRM|nr:beta-ketoacyl-ACP synthase II [Candidatus Weimeria bifida]RRF96542.1 MAG: beta-ketoacyl-[acyl-carrier-protein] synthase II [Lachnospiraceae bacterium]